MNYILGISAFYHDSAITLIRDGEIIFSIEEEKFSRIKHDKEFPAKSLTYCLNLFKITLSDISYLIFYDKPLTKFERLLETYVSFAPFGWTFYKSSLPEWMSGKIFLEKKIRKHLKESNLSLDGNQNILFCEHHLSHAASAFFPSPYESAAILCLDGVGEWDTASAWIGNGNKIEKLWSIEFPHSLGLLYSAFTYYLGFEVNNGEYKMMGLSPYGRPLYSELIEKYLIDIKDDGSFMLNMSFFSFTTDVVMINTKFSSLFEHEVRGKNEDIKQFHMDIAASIQEITEKIVLLLAKNLKKQTGLDSLCMAGGVALNCVANGKLKEEEIFKNIWIQPASGDAGGSLGAAYSCWYQYLDKKRCVEERDSMKSSLLGPEYSNEEVRSSLLGMQCIFTEVDDIENLTANEIKKGNVIGWFQGRAEYGPRALGNRSILADPRSKEMQKKLNMNIKFRESFRPFAPAILEEKASDYFLFSGISPYMLFTARVKGASYEENTNSNIFEKLKNISSEIPAITHINLSSRLQTINHSSNEKFYNLISRFEEITNVPILINTSFNIRGEPIVLSPEDAIRCFMNTGMDILVLNNFILYKEDQDLSLFKKYTTKELREENSKVSYLKPVSRIELEMFGIHFFIISIIVFGLIIPWAWNYSISYPPFAIGVITILLRFFFLRGLLLFYYPWTFFVKALTFIKIKLLLFLSYYLLISPVGLFMKLIGKDSIKKKFIKNKKSYLIKSSGKDFDPNSFRFPF